MSMRSFFFSQCSREGVLPRGTGCFWAVPSPHRSFWCCPGQLQILNVASVRDWEALVSQQRGVGKGCSAYLQLLWGAGRGLCL